MPSFVDIHGKNRNEAYIPGVGMFYAKRITDGRGNERWEVKPL
jgi:hypothetical protein